MNRKFKRDMKQTLWAFDYKQLVEIEGASANEETGEFINITEIETVLKSLETLGYIEVEEVVER